MSTMKRQKRPRPACLDVCGWVAFFAIMGAGDKASLSECGTIHCLLLPASVFEYTGGLTFWSGCL